MSHRNVVRSQLDVHCSRCTVPDPPYPRGQADTHTRHTDWHSNWKLKEKRLSQAEIQGHFPFVASLMGAGEIESGTLHTAQAEQEQSDAFDSYPLSARICEAGRSFSDLEAR